MTAASTDSMTGGPRAHRVVDVAQRLFSRQLAHGGLLRWDESRDVLRRGLARCHRGGVCRRVRLLHPLVQREEGEAVAQGNEPAAIQTQPGRCRIIVRYGKTVPPPLVEISGSNSGKSTIFGGLADLWSLVVESDSSRQLSELGFCGRNFLRSEYGPLKEADLRFRTTEYRRFARIRGSFSNKGSGVQQGKGSAGKGSGLWRKV